MQAVILAGGLGTRLRPLTYTTPKPLIQIRGKAFLDCVIELLKEKGMDNFVICSSYLAHKIQDYYKNGKKFGIKITHAVESSPLGTAGAIKNAAFYLDDVFFVINGDTYLDIDYKDIYEKFSESDKIGMLVVYTGEETWERVNDTLVKDGKVILYSKDGKDKRVQCVWAGVALFKKAVVNYIQSARAVNLEDETFRELIEKGELLAYETKTRYYDIGTKERMKKFEEFISKGAK